MCEKDIECRSRSTLVDLSVWRRNETSLTFVLEPGTVPEADSIVIKAFIVQTYACKVWINVNLFMNVYSFIHPYNIKKQRTYETTQYIM